MGAAPPTRTGTHARRRVFPLIPHEIEPKIRDPVSLTTTREREEMDGEEERRGGVQVAIVRTVVRSSGEWRIIVFVST